MSATATDDALDRLNYFNGQRLAASDFRTEQKYHMGVRRVLNRSLYSAGIVTGLEVTPDPSSTHRVIVGHGLAFDNQGREIFVPTDTPVQVMGTPSSSKGVVFGNLLAVSYREARENMAMSGCTVPPSGKGCSGDLAWGAPTRVVAQAVFEFLDAWPADDSGKVILAQIELSKTCDVMSVLPGVRKYAMPTKPQTVQSLSLEGEKDLDSANRKDLYFHVVNGLPSTVTLYLRGRTLSSLYYTELGDHTHDLNLDTQNTEHDFTHHHQVTAGTTDSQGQHTHSFIVDAGETKGGIDVNNTNGDFITGNNPIQPAGAHTHTLEGLVLSTELSDWTHHHGIQGATEKNGASNKDARTGKPALATFTDLTIFLDGQPITEPICNQLEAQPGQAGLWRLEPSPGDIRMNGATLSLPDGTGEIDLLKLDLDIGLGQHVLSFRVSDADEGGQLQYNLYVG
jgi:hypothetical protein